MNKQANKFKVMYLERTSLLQIDLIKQQLRIRECAESTGGMATANNANRQTKRGHTHTNQKARKQTN